MQQRSRSPAFLDAAPRQEGEGASGREAGSLVPWPGVRCPHCRKKLAEELHGTAVFVCTSTRCRDIDGPSKGRRLTITH